MPPLDHAAAAQAANDVLHEHGWNVRDLAQAADLDPGTVGDFLSGVRWPRTGTRGRLEQALGLTPGTLQRIAEGKPLREQAQPEQPVGLGLDAEADGLTPEEIEPVLAIVRAIKRAKGLDRQ